MFGADQLNPGVQERQFYIQHVEHGAGTHFGLALYASRAAFRPWVSAWACRCCSRGVTKGVVQAWGC